MAKNKKKEIESNPFSVLKNVVLEQKDTSAPKNTGKKGKGSSSFEKNHKEDFFLEEDDTSLFLSAVQSVQPVSQKEVYSSKETQMSEVFAELGKKNNPSKEIKTSSAHTGKAVSAVQNRQETSIRVSSTSKESVKPEESHLFTEAMSGVTPVKGKGRDLAKPPEKPSAKALAPVDVMQQLLDGTIEFALHNTGEYIEGHVIGVDPMVIEQLRAGALSPEAHIDLHGQNAEQAYETLSYFLKHSYQKNMRTVIVVTGRGKNSPSGIGIIRSMLPLWLTRNPFKRVVLGFCSARPHDGGAGAVYVLLRKYKKSRGKIIWDIPHGGSIDSLM